MADLTKLFDTFDQLIGAAAIAIDDDALRPHAEVARNVRKRSGFLGETVVIALAGGTGSGKSSLLNALAGEEVATVGAIRPTTSRPLAWIPRTPEPGLVRLLDDMGVEERVGHSADTSLAIIDMPDVDSVVGAHRAVFEALLPRVDVVWWVVDPEKYNDRLLHKDYLEPLAAYQEQFLFVLNQIDRLEPAALADVVDDLKARLSADGIASPTILPVAARPVSGDPLGLDALWRSTRQRQDAKTAALRKLVVDVRRSAAAVVGMVGLESIPSVGFDERWADTRDRTAAALARMVIAPETTRQAVAAGSALALRSGAGPVGSLVHAVRANRVARALGMTTPEGATTEAIHAWADRPGQDAARGLLGTLIADLAFEVGGPFGAAIRSRFPAPTIDRLTDEAVEVATHHRGHLALDRAGWWSLVRGAKWLLALVFVGAVISWFFLPPPRGEIPWAIVAAVGALVVGLAMTRLLDWSGRRRGMAAALDLVDSFTVEISRQLERGFGMALRSILRERALIGAAHVELGLVAAEVEADLLASR